MDQNTYFNFGTRKIQKVRYSYLTPLPVQWVKSMKLFKGDSLRIEMLDDYSLKITPVPSDSCQDCGTTATNKDFAAWAKEKCARYPEIIKHMQNSFDPLERAIAIRILKNAGVDQL